MEVKNTHIEDLVIAKFPKFEDERGEFGRLFCLEELSNLIGDRHIVQINFSKTKAIGSIRGFHYQNSPYAEMKLIRCIRGKVCDVAVDIRKESSTFLKHFSQELSEENGLMMVIPEGFAHGFQVLEANSELLYLHTASYNKKSEAGLLYNDPILAVDWPLPVAELSERDKSHKLIQGDFEGARI